MGGRFAKKICQSWRHRRIRDWQEEGLGSLCRGRAGGEQLLLVGGPAGRMKRCQDGSLPWQEACLIPELLRRGN